MSKVIVIDPGHGGWDSGAVACDGKLEKNFNLEMGLAVRDALATYDCQVIMTRTADVALGPRGDDDADLGNRAAIANQAKAALFLSIHHDADGNPAARGASLYEWTNKPGWLYAVDGGDINHTDPKTHPKAETALPILREAFTGLGIPWRGDIMCSDFQVLRDTTMPAMLLECFFGSSHADVTIMRQPGTIPTLAKGVARAIASALEIPPPVPAWTPQSEVDRLLKRGIITTRHEANESVEWWELAAVANRILDHIEPK